MKRLYTPTASDYARYARYNGLAEDTRAAMEAAPNYWVAWYTVKSIALVGAIAALAYYVGKNSR